MIAPLDLTTKAAEIRAGLEGVVERHAAATPATMDCRAWHDIGLLLALIEQQAAELAERDAEITLTESLVADERKMRFAAESERDEARAALQVAKDGWRDAEAAAATLKAERDELLREKERLGALVEACAEYLKEGETPRERMDRDFKDTQALTELLAEARRDRDIHNGHRRIAEAKLMALQAGGVLEGRALLPVEPTDEMLAATCDASGRMRLMEFTRPEERSAPFLVPRYSYRAMVQAARSANSALENGPAGLADANPKSPDPTPSQSERIAVLEAALRATLNAGRGSSGRIILDPEQETVVSAALHEAKWAKPAALAPLGEE